VVPIEIANKYTGLSLAERPVILKMHGAIDRDDPQRNSYVLTEESYIDSSQVRTSATRSPSR
jgi:hypothetical protein